MYNQCMQLRVRESDMLQSQRVRCVMCGLLTALLLAGVMHMMPMAHMWETLVSATFSQLYGINDHIITGNETMQDTEER